MADFKVGTVTHYYDKIGVAVLDLTSPLHVGDHIRVSGSVDFSQKVESMQMEHEQVESAQAGETVGIKISKQVKPGDEIVKTN